MCFFFQSLAQSQFALYKLYLLRHMKISFYYYSEVQILNAKTKENGRE